MIILLNIQYLSLEWNITSVWYHIPNNFKDLNILSKTDNVTNNVMNTLATNSSSQENQDYYNQRDQQYIARKYNGGLE